MWRAHSPSGWRGASKSMCSLTVTTTGCVGVAVTNANAVQCGRSPRLESLWSRLQRPHSWHRTRSHLQSCRSRSGRLQRNACSRRCRLFNGRHHRHRCRRRQRYRQHCAPTRLRRPTFAQPRRREAFAANAASGGAARSPATPVPRSQLRGRVLLRLRRCIHRHPRRRSLQHNHCLPRRCPRPRLPLRRCRHPGPCPRRRPRPRSFARSWKRCS